MTLSEESLERAFARLMADAGSAPELARELAVSRERYFGSGSPSDGDSAAPLAERRHREWFLCERYSDVLQDVPIRALGRVIASTDPLLEEALGALASSLTGVFAVTGIAAGEGLWVRDLVGLGEYPLEEAEGSLALREDDVLVGRLFPLGENVYRISHAAGVFRTPGLVAALESDLAHARAERRGTLRLSQLELEAMFFGAAAGSPTRAADDAVAASPTPSANALPTDPADARATVEDRRAAAHARALAELCAAGLSETVARQALVELAGAPYDPAVLVHGSPDDPLGMLLSRIAFETSADLESARRVLLRAWPAIGARTPAGESNAAGSQEPRRGQRRTLDAESALDAFDRGRRAGRDLEELFAELERDLELDSAAQAAGSVEGPGPGAPGDAYELGEFGELGELGDGPRLDDEETAPDFPGVVGAMVEEFLWEVGLEEGPGAAGRHRCLDAFARFASPHGVFENLGERDLIAFLALWLPEHGGLRNGPETVALVDSLRKFCAWAQERHDVPLESALADDWSDLRECLPRLVSVNARLSREPETEPNLATDRVVEYLGGGRARDGSGTERVVAIPEPLEVDLRAGDRLRVRAAADSGLRVVCCYPRQCARLGIEA